MPELQIDCTGEEAPKEFEVMPAGEYPAMILSGEYKQPKDQNSPQYLQLEVCIDGGQFDGRKITDRCAYLSPNEVARAINMKRLKSILFAVQKHRGGSLKMDCVEDVCSLPLNVKIKVRPAKDQYQAQNEIEFYYERREIPSIGELASSVQAENQQAALSAPASSNTPQGQPVASGGAKAPWE